MLPALDISRQGSQDARGVLEACIQVLDEGAADRSTNIAKENSTGFAKEEEDESFESVMHRQPVPHDG